MAVLAGSGEARLEDGPYGKGSFGRPEGLALSPDGRVLYVADKDAHAIRKVSLGQGSIETLSGGVIQGLSDGAKSMARFYAPTELAWGPDGRSLLVIDQDRRAIRVLTPEDGSVRTLTATVASGIWTGLLSLEGSTYVMDEASGQYFRLNPVSGTLELVLAEPALRNPWVLAVAGGGRIHAYASQSGQIYSFKPPAAGAVSATAEAKDVGTGLGPFVWVGGPWPKEGAYAWDSRLGHFIGVGHDGQIVPRDHDGEAMALTRPIEGGSEPIPGARAAFPGPMRLIYDPIQARLIISEAHPRRISAMQLGMDTYEAWDRRLAIPKALGRRRFLFVGTSILLWEEKTVLAPAASLARRFEDELGVRARVAGLDWAPEAFIWHRGAPWYAGSPLSTVWTRAGEAKKAGVDEMVIVLDQGLVVQEALGFAHHRCEDEVVVDPMDPEWLALSPEEKAKGYGPTAKALHRIFKASPERFHGALAGQCEYVFGDHYRGLDDPEVRRLAWPIVVKAVKKAAAASKEAGLPVTVVYLMHSTGVSSDTHHLLSRAWFAEDLGRACREAGLGFVDVSGDMRAYARTYSNFYVTGIHLSTRGHSWVARMIAARWPLQR